MSTKTSLVARQYRLQEWAAQIQDCKNRPSDMTVAQWCDQHDITTANYYYRQGEVRKALLSSKEMPFLSEVIRESDVRFSKERSIRIII